MTLMHEIQTGKQYLDGYGNRVFVAYKVGTTTDPKYICIHQHHEYSSLEVVEYDSRGRRLDDDSPNALLQTDCSEVFIVGSWYKHKNYDLFYRVVYADKASVLVENVSGKRVMIEPSHRAGYEEVFFND